MRHAHDAEGEQLALEMQKKPEDETLRRIASDWLEAHGTWTYTVGLDLGQRQDPSALAAVGRGGTRSGVALTYRCVGLQRWHLGTPYPQVVEDTRKLLTRPELRDAPLVVDQTGVGVAVVDFFRERLDRHLVAVNITGGRQCSRLPNGDWSVPKIDLVAVIQSLMGRRMLALPPRTRHKLAGVLEAELRNFKVKVTQAGNETMSAWRESDNDDLELALAISCWFSDRGGAVIDNTAAASSGRSAIALAPEGVFHSSPSPARRDGGYAI